MDTRLTPMHELLQYAEDRNIAIGAFEFWSFEVARAALAAADIEYAVLNVHAQSSVSGMSGV